MTAGDELLVVRHDEGRPGRPDHAPGWRPRVGVPERSRRAPRRAGLQRRAEGTIQECGDGTIVPSGIPVRRRRGANRRPEARMGARARPTEWGASGGIATAAGAARGPGSAPKAGRPALAEPLPAVGLRRTTPARAGSARGRAFRRTVARRTIVPGAVGITTDIARSCVRTSATGGSLAGRTSLSGPSGLAASGVSPPRAT
jgi:hypothetical protein